MFGGKWKSEMLLLMTVIDKSEGKTPKEERACALSLVENLIAQSLKKKLFVVLDRHQNHFRPLIIAWRGASVGLGQISTNGQPEVLKLI